MSLQLGVPKLWLGQRRVLELQSNSNKTLLPHTAEAGLSLLGSRSVKRYDIFCLRNKKAPYRCDISENSLKNCKQKASLLTREETN